MDPVEIRQRVIKYGWLAPWSEEQALQLGLFWYFPQDKATGAASICPNGEHILMRDIKSGRCVVCQHARRAATVKGARGRPVDPRSAIMRECPELILPRKEAMAQGWSVFRTGEPCEAGHTGWRYVNNCQCIECKRKPA